VSPNGGDATASVGAALDAAASQSTVDAETASSRPAAEKGDETEAWQRMALKEIEKKVEHDLQCAVQSYGQVQQFFLRHPCDKLDQQLFAVVDGDTILDCARGHHSFSDLSEGLVVPRTHAAGRLS
jgi:hypothetical protein